MPMNLKACASVWMATAVALAGTSAVAQQSTGPMFSTPASRSTVGSPILNDPTANQKGDIIGNTGKDRPSAPGQNARPSTQGPATASHQSSKVKNWQVQCIDAGKNQKRCQAVGDVLSADGKQVILVMALATTANGESTAAQIAVPLGIALKAGIKVDVGDKYSITMPASRCTSQGCLAEGKVEPALLDAMKTQATATVTIATPDGKAIPIKLPLDGFRDAFTSLQSTRGNEPK